MLSRHGAPLPCVIDSSHFRTKLFRVRHALDISVISVEIHERVRALDGVLYRLHKLDIRLEVVILDILQQLFEMRRLLRESLLPFALSRHPFALSRHPCVFCVNPCALCRYPRALCRNTGVFCLYASLLCRHPCDFCVNPCALCRHTDGFCLYASVLGVSPRVLG